MLIHDIKCIIFCIKVEKLFSTKLTAFNPGAIEVFCANTSSERSGRFTLEAGRKGLAPGLYRNCRMTGKIHINSIVTLCTLHVFILYVFIH